MDNLNQFRSKYGYDKDKPYTRDERFKQDKIQSDWDWQARENIRKQEENERRKREEERRKERINTNVEALSTLESSKTELNQYGVDSQSKKYNQDTNRVLKMSENQPVKNNKNNRMSQFTGFNQELRNDINNRISEQKFAGMSEKEIQESLIPKEDNEVQKRLDAIADKIKPGKENFLYNVKEGWYEREVQNMLSKEYVRKMNGLSNNVETIESFLEENPDLMQYTTGDENVLEKFWKGGVRFLGSGTRLQFDSYKESAQDPMSYVWGGAILAASIMAAPVTGGASLAAAPLAASSPLLVSQMPLIAKTFASLKPLAAISFGMKYGALKNMTDLEAGSAYNEYLQEGIDHRIAAPMASTVGAFNGVVEYMQIDSALSAIPGLSSLVENGAKMAQKELVKEATKVITNYGIDLGANVLEEMAQGGVTELGLGLSRYLQDTPDPSTIGGLQALGKTMASEDFRNVLLEEGYGALQSMWLSPIVSSAGRVAMDKSMQGVGNTIDKTRITNHLHLEQQMDQKKLKNDMDYILEKGGATDQAIRIVNETRDSNALGFLMSEKQVLEDMIKREDTTNQDKERINKTLEKIDTVLSRTMYDVKDENPNINYKPTNAIDVESDLVSEGFLNDNELYNEKLTNYNIELYNLAKEHNALDLIKEELNKGTNKAEIMNKVTKLFPRKQRKPLNIMSIINSVDMVQNETKAQIVMNNLYNLSEVHNNKAEKVNLNENIVDNITNLEENLVNEEMENNDLLESDLSNETDSSNVIASEGIENLNTVATEPVVGDNEVRANTNTEFENNLDNRQEIEGKEGLKDIVNEVPMAEGEFKAADIKVVPVNKINVDPDRFQFRYDRGNEGGATRKLTGTEYNPLLAGTILLWEDEHNDLYVVNGHHRVDLAKDSGINEMDARILSHRNHTADEARALGAMVNIAEDNATSIDVAKLIRDTGVSETDFNEVGIRANSKIAKDGIALSKLNDWIFTQVATRGIAIERAVIIGRELGDNPDGQNQMIAAIGKIESKGQAVTNDVLTELIAEVKGTAREEFTEMTLFGEETFTKNYSLERAELVSYVKRQLRDRVSLLKNVSKNKNAAILQELGNNIAIDDNVKEMNTADQALWIMDATLNYKGTKTNELFNALAKEYASVDPMNRGKVKKQALDQLITLMEGGQLLDETINQEVKKEGIKDSILNARTDGEGRQESFGISEDGLEKQVNLFGLETVNQLKEKAKARIVANEDVKTSRSYKATSPIAEAISNNPIFNGLTIKYSDKSGKVEMMSKEDLSKHGYGHLQEQGEKYIYGFYNDGDRTITLNQEATRDTILEEAIHDIQFRLQEIDPDLHEVVELWEQEVREKAEQEGIAIPEGYELLAQSLVYTEFGYASTNEYVADLIAVDDEIVNKFKVLLGEEIAEKGFGFVDSEIAKKDRVLNVEKVKSDIKASVESGDMGTYVHEDNGNYAIAHRDGEGYQVSYFNEELGHVVNMDFDTAEEVADKLVDDGIYQLKSESANRIYDRSVADELYKRKFLQAREGKDNNSKGRGANVSNKLTGWDIRKVREAINSGNFTLNDYQELIENSEDVSPHVKQVLGDLVIEAKKKGLERPNNEVTFKQFLYRFYGVDIKGDSSATIDEISKNWIYHLDSAVEKHGYESQAKDEVINYFGLDDGEWDDFYEGQAKLAANTKAVNNINKRLMAQHKYFQDKIDTYRFSGLQYQLKPMDEKIDSPEFRNWFGDSKVVDGYGQPLVVHHGTWSEFNEFRSGYQFFSRDENFASTFGDTNEYYLSIQNLFDPFNKEHFNRLNELVGNIIPNLDEVYEAAYFDLNHYDSLDENYGEDMPRDDFKNRYTSILDYRDFDSFEGDKRLHQQTWLLFEQHLDAIKSLGYDGLKITEDDAENYVAFNPTQIKSINNVGLFSPANPDVNYQLKNSRNNTEQYSLEIGDTIFNDFIQGDKTTSYMYSSENADGVATLNIDRAIEDTTIYNMAVKDAVLEGYDYIKMGDSEPIVVNNQMIESAMTKDGPIFQMKEEGTNGNLLVMHNLTEGKLKSAIKLGGFPVASFAITKKDQAHTNFGEISLIFNSDTIDPSNKDNKVYGADVYSPRFPSVGYNIDANKMRDLMSRLQEISGIDAYLDESQFSDTDIEEAATRLMSKDFMKVAFLNESNLTVDVPMMAPDTRFQANSLDNVVEFINKNNLTYADIVENEGLREQYFKTIKEGFLNLYDTLPALAENVANREIEKIGQRIEFDAKTGIHKNDPHVVQLTKDFNIAKGLLEQVKDVRKYNDLINEAVADKEEQFKEYIKLNIEPLYGEMGLRNDKELFTPSGNRRSWKQLYDAYHIDNVLKIMKGNMRDEEGFNYGLGNVRAGITEEFKTLDDIRKNQDLLVDGQTFEVEKERYNNIYKNLETRSTKFHSEKYGNAFDYAMGEVSKKKRINNEAVIKALKGNAFRVNEMPTELITEITGFINDLKTMPTEYFEAIPQRIVGLNEIQAVVAPNSLSAEMEQMLLENGINLIEKYGPQSTIGWRKFGENNFGINIQNIKKDLIFNETGLSLDEVKAKIGDKLTDEILTSDKQFGTVQGQDRQVAVDNVLREKDLTFQIKDSWNSNDINEYYQMKEEKQDMKERSWGQTVRDANITSKELKDLLTSERFMYEVKHNQDTVLEAAKLIDQKGESWVEARVLSDLDNDATLFAASQILTYKYMESGETDRAMILLDRTAQKATSAGQAIQILSVWGRQTPEGMLRDTISKFQKLMTEADKKSIRDKTQILKEEFNRINREAINSIDFIDSVKKVQDMTTDEIVTRDIMKTDIGKQLLDKYDLDTVLKTVKGEETSVDQMDIEDLLSFKKEKTNIDDNMTSKIINTINNHYLEGKGKLKDKLMDLGLNEFEADTLEMYAKQQLKEATKDSKSNLIKDTLKKGKHERQGLDEKIIEASLDNSMDDNKIKALIAEKEGMPVLSDELIEYIYAQGQYINSLEEGSRERDVATAKLKAEIANHLPTSVWSKIGTIQTMSHLLNVRTTLRNLIGNELFAKVDTVVQNYLGSSIDKIASLKTKQRTTIHRNIFKLFKTQYKGYYQGWKLGLEDALLGINTSDESSKYGLRKERTFTSGPLGALETVLNVTMRATDQAAQTAGYWDSIEEQMMIAGVDKPTEQMMDNALVLGLYRTFNDETALSKAFGKGRKGLNDFSSYFTGQTEFGLGDLVLKYPSTPANILARAMDYSPIGAITTMLQLYKDTSGDPYLRQKMAVQGISRAIAGSAMIGAGVLLAKLGVVTGGDPEEDKNIYEMRKQAGLRDYGINTTAIMRHLTSGFKDPRAGELRRGDNIMSYDWVEPMAIPIAIGADTASGGDALSIMDTALRATTKGMQALTDQPLLTGLSKLFGYGDPVSGTAGAILDMPASFTPTLLGHIANFIDGDAKDFYTNYSKSRRAYNAVLNKVPGAKGQLPDRYSLMGEKIKYYPENIGVVSKLMRSIISPAFYGDYEPTKEEQLIFDLYDSTGSADHVPRKPQREYTFNKVKYTLTPEEHEKMSRWIGMELTARIRYAESNYMKGWDDESKVDEIKWIIGELSKEAREKVAEMKGVNLDDAE